MNLQWFEKLWEARRKLVAWQEYNNERPHSALGYQTPARVRRRVLLPH